MTDVVDPDALASYELQSSLFMSFGLTVSECCEACDWENDVQTSAKLLHNAHRLSMYLGLQRKSVLRDGCRRQGPDNNVDDGPTRVLKIVLHYFRNIDGRHAETPTLLAPLAHKLWQGYVGANPELETDLKAMLSREANKSRAPRVQAGVTAGPRKRTRCEELVISHVLREVVEWIGLPGLYQRPDTPHAISAALKIAGHVAESRSAGRRRQSRRRMTIIDDPDPQTAA